ncbi:hypothetical protein [Niallia sp. 01092]|uniref:hypothetical protein n=1 Tax=unclassified Niallia TaxID=2837522 RepID=UPI003FD47866
MNSSDKYNDKNTPFFKKMYFLVSLIILALFITVYAIIEHFFTDPFTAKKDLGEKVIVTLPNGKKVYTYENLIVEENGKLLYKGERNTIDLTGGVVVQEDWK